MATLAAQIETDLRILAPSQTLIDGTNVRDDDAVEDTTRTAKVCAHAAAKVASFLGDVDGDDTEAVEIGTRLALARLLGIYPGQANEAHRESIAEIEAELVALAERRVNEVDPEITERERPSLDAAYPDTVFDEADDDEE